MTWPEGPRTRTLGPDALWYRLPGMRRHARVAVPRFRLLARPKRRAAIAKPMRIYVLEREMLAPVSLQEAFRVFENPHNLARITPPWLAFRILTGRIAMRPGLRIDYEIRWLGIPLRWKTLISEYEPPFFFVDEQTSGPYRFWRHRHTFRPTAEGTVVGDRVEYALPFGWIGRIAHRLVVRRQLERIFDYRHRALAQFWQQSRVG